MLERRDPLAEFSLLAAEEDRRAREALRVYRPAKQMPFHLSNARELILRGGKRSGKSLGVVAEFASRVLGERICGPSGKMIPLKFPVSTPKDPLLYWVIGWDVDHIGQTIHRLLFQPGIFRAIRDVASGQWRTYNPADPNDLERQSESIPVEPMIPERVIDPNSWSWENKAARNFSSVRLKNGAMICAYPSSAKHPKQGDAVAGIWIDEDIQNPNHLKEWQDRMTDKDGWLLWSVWPHTKNFALCEMIDRSDEQMGSENPDIESFQLIMSENPYLPDAAKRRALARMGNEDEVARRDRGELLLDTIAMYDFVSGVHCLRPYESGEMPNKVTTARELIRKMYTQDGRFPREWTRYASIDPSHVRTAVLLAVVPPTEWENVFLGNLMIVEKELILKKFSSKMLADVMAKEMQGYNYEAFIMDQQIGRQTRVGEDKTIFQNYADAFASVGLRARMNPHGFIPGCNVPQIRYRAVRNMLEFKPSGLPGVLFIEYTTVATQREFNTYRKKQLLVGGEDTVMDEPANPRKHDAMAALEYLCAFMEAQFETGTAYVSPTQYEGGGSKAYRKAMQIIKKHQEAGGSFVHLGPGAAA